MSTGLFHGFVFLI